MVLLTSCGQLKERLSESNFFSENAAEKFNLETDGLIREGKEWRMVEESLKALDRYFYLHGKYDLDFLSYLRTKIHVQTDSLIFGEIYVRGKNSFDGVTINHNTFIYYSVGGTYFFDYVDTDDLVHLHMRMSLENTFSEKNKILVKYVTKNGYLNDETDYDNQKRNYSSSFEEKQIPFAKKFLNEKLNID